MKPSKLKFIPLGGSGEIGMNLNLYAYEDRYLMIDLGVSFGRDWGLDVIMPDPQFIEEQQDKLDGLILTHAHEDHLGAVPYLWSRLRCPIYATPFTAGVVREKLKEFNLVNEVPLIEIPLEGTLKIGAFDIEFIRLTHSIPEPNALAIKTPEGTVVHTGDWKLDPDPLIGKPSDLSRLETLGHEGVLALVCDSTNVFVEEPTVSEATVRDSLIEIIAQQKGRVAVSLFASNVARMASCAIAAQKTGRKVALAGRSLFRMNQIARSCGYMEDIEPFISDKDARQLPPEEVMYLCTGSQGEPRAALTRIARKNHPFVKLDENDTVIFSSRMIPGNEKEIQELQETLRASGINVILDKVGSLTHVSGHPGRHDLQQMYALLQPKILVPVHGENIHMQEQANFAKSCGVPHAVVPYNGVVIGLHQEGATIEGTVPAGRLAVDGNQIISFESPHIQDRRYLSNFGAAFVTLSLEDGESVEQPLISLVGIASDEDTEADIIEQVFREIAIGFDALSRDNLYIDEKVADMVRLATRRGINAVCGIKPHVVTHIIRN